MNHWNSNLQLQNFNNDLPDFLKSLESDQKMMNECFTTIIIFTLFNVLLLKFHKPYPNLHEILSLFSSFNFIQSSIYSFTQYISFLIELQC